MLTGDQYRESLRDGRLTYFEGRQIADISVEPVLRDAVDQVAGVYDKFYSAEPGAINPLLTAPNGFEELKDRLPALHEADIVTNTTFQSLMTVLTASAKVAETNGEYVERINAYVDEAQRNDIRITECITDAKGNRAVAPGKQHDPDAYVHVVDRQRDGVVIRGAKLHITGASFGHDLMVMPTKNMKPGEEEYAITCAVPVSTPGVRIVNTTYAPRHPDSRHFPHTDGHHMPDGFVIFDDVFVPHERVFLDGETGYAAVFAHALGLWERLGGLAAMADQADMLVGLAQLIAEANGLSRESHIKEKISEMLIHATLVRAALEAAIAHCDVTADGAAFPNELYTNAGKYQGAAQYGLMVRHLHDIAGGAVVTTPAISDLENPDVGPLLRKYLSTGPEVEGEYRAKLFHAIRDLTADSYGGWHLVTNIQSGGGLYAQRIVTRRYYDMDRAKQLALGAAGMADGHMLI
ncbi:MAG: 4-hydroxyphenylacetate 3-hydroxylase [Acidimicrobiia bacterium]|nr:4-hydroxyphenylacetate 3-hydroxylase [Acidimicrobiia bacterium]